MTHLIDSAFWVFDFGLAVRAVQSKIENLKSKIANRSYRSVGLGKQIRLNRLFGHPSGRLCSVAVDHFVGYQEGLPEGLRDLPATLKAIVAGRPDAVTMQIGVARTCWLPYAGRVPLIVQSIMGRPDDTSDEHLAEPEDALRLGADAFATCAFVRGKSEAAHLRRVADHLRRAEVWDMPVVLHIYPRQYSADGSVAISFEPEDIAWAVRCGIEVGVDVIKVPYCGDVAAYGQIVQSCPVPVVAAGGPRTDTLGQALEMAARVVASGARGMTIGRNIWGCPQLTEALLAFKAVIHDGAAPAAAMKHVGL
jgi:class I fructose-bisphosphate aldolase